MPSDEHHHSPRFDPLLDVTILESMLLHQGAATRPGPLNWNLNVTPFPKPLFFKRPHGHVDRAHVAFYICTGAGNLRADHCRARQCAPLRRLFDRSRLIPLGNLPSGGKFPVIFCTINYSHGSGAHKRRKCAPFNRLFKVIRAADSRNS